MKCTALLSSKKRANGSSSNRRDDDSKIKRPMNCFLLYRQDMILEGMPSREIAPTWKSMPLDHPVKVSYEQRATQVALDHKRLYPEYKYEPIKKARRGLTVKQVVLGVKVETPEEAEKRKRKNEKQNEVKRVKRRSEIEAQHTQNCGQSGSSRSSLSSDITPLSSCEPEIISVADVEIVEASQPSPSSTSIPLTSGIIKSKNRRIFEVVHREDAHVLEERPYLGEERNNGYLNCLEGHYGSIYKKYDILENCDEVPYGAYDDRILLTDEPMDYADKRTVEEDIAYVKEFYDLARKTVKSYSEIIGTSV